MMCGQKRWMLVCFILLICSSQVLAFTFDASPESVTIKQGESARFIVSITNDGNFPDTFRIFILHYPDFEMFTQPLENPITVDVNPGDTITKEVNIRPIAIQDPGLYIVELKAQSRTTQDTSTIQRKIGLSAEASQGSYTPTVTIKSQVPSDVKPNEPLKIVVQLKNQNNLQLDNLTLRVSSLSKRFSDERVVALGPKGSLTESFEFHLNPRQPPEEDTLGFELLYKGSLIATPSLVKYSVIPYNDIRSAASQRDTFLKKETYITYTNDGNVLYQGTVNVEFAWFQRYFLSTQPESKFVYDNGKRYVTWDLNLEPGQSTEVLVELNYRVFFYALILAIILVIMYYILRSPLILLKASTLVERGEEGGIKEMKIMITVRNRSKKGVTKIQISDQVPTLVRLRSEAEIGTLKPSKVLAHESKGTMLKWDVERLEGGEERVMTYHLTARLAVTGGMTLPRAKASYDSGKRKGTTSSLPLSID